MPFILEAWTDGACRRNGYPDAVGGAGVWFPRYPPGNRAEPLPQLPHSTSSRAELTAIILALEAVNEKQEQICAGNNFPPFFHVTINSDSEYSVKCLNEWILDWIQNGWRTYDNRPVINSDLIFQAHNLRLEIEGAFKGARITFNHVSRAENVTADQLANDGCDKAEMELQAIQNGFY
ncbi:Ribonuclease H1 [Mycena venus]|uniref:ribonuclease H n=1 Tax=Mycena venus TaxID=2733690 RepID=A0A8H6WQV0_9AGAR|nr:Ribonuclease H1 [Mycena venus]